jgi:UPF0148 protein
LRDEDVSKMARMLLAGGKMLSLHCIKCKSPLFEYEGKITCPICGEQAGEARPKPTKAEATVAPTDIESALTEKLNQLVDEFRRERDRHAISELLELIRSILDVLEKLRKG